MPQLRKPMNVEPREKKLPQTNLQQTFRDMNVVSAAEIIRVIDSRPEVALAVHP